MQKRFDFLCFENYSICIKSHETKYQIFPKSNKNKFYLKATNGRIMNYLRINVKKYK